MRVAIVGAGVSGLCAADHLRRERPDIDVQIFEASPRPGGGIRTEIADGFVIDRGPEAILTQRPSVMRWMSTLGLEDEIVSTSEANRGAYVVSHGHLERIPLGFSVVAPSQLRSVWRSPVLSRTGKLRASLEPFVPRRKSQTDESIASFVRRRFGDELFDRLAQPIAAGVYGGRAETISMRSTLPRFVEYERDHGSVLRGLRAAASDRPAETGYGARYGMFVNFRKGMQTLVDRLAERAGTSLHLSSEVRRIASNEDGWLVDVEGRSPERFDGVILALPASRSASLLGESFSHIRELLTRTVYGDAAIVTMAWRRDQIKHPLDAFGFVVPEVEGLPILASTWSSLKWPGRAPKGYVLLRVFVGNDAHPHLFDASDATLLKVAREQMGTLLGVEAAPELTRIDRFRRAMPRYQVGHSTLVRTLDNEIAKIRGLALAGNSHHGVGIPTAMESGERAARAIGET